MTITIYENPISPHSRRIRILAIELKLALEWQLVDFQKGEHKGQPNLARNANGKVPTMVDGDFTLWESNAIMEYLADGSPNGAALYPKDLKARAEVNRWLFWASAHIGPAAGMLTYERFMKKMIMKQDADPSLVAFGEESIKRYTAVLDEHLAKREYVAGGSFTLADIALGCAYMYRVPAGMDLTPFKNVETWLARIESRDSWTQTKPPF